MKARERYDRLSSQRNEFLNVAKDCSRLTLPYLVKLDDQNNTHTTLKTPWQSVGAKSTVTLASKLMMALLPPQTTFFKLQIRDDKVGEEIPPEIKSELDLSFSKIERMIMETISASNDRVVVHQAIKHLIVAGNALIYMGKDGLKNYPLNRFVVNRDGNGNVLEIVTKELISRQVLGMPLPTRKPDSPGDDGEAAGGIDDDVEVYTYVKLDDKSGRWKWHQEVFDKVLPNSQGSAPKNASPWLPLRFNSVDGEDYGRGRVEEFLGDLRSLEALSQALIEGSAAAAKVVFLVSPSSTTKPQTLAQAGNGAVIQGRVDDVSVVQVGKTADFRTAAEMAQTISQRIYDAFLVLNVRQSERTTAEEVRLTQLELEGALGNIFSLLTVEFLVPYLNRKLLVLTRSNKIPSIPKEFVQPTIVAGVNALGRGQDQESLIRFITTVSQTMGPESIAKYIDPTEYLKRLAAAQGIEVMNLVKDPQQLQAEMQQQQQQAAQQELVKQAGQFASSPMMDPSKQQPNDESQASPEAGGEEEAAAGPSS
jgi:hypothetical protein